MHYIKVQQLRELKELEREYLAEAEIMKQKYLEGEKQRHREAMEKFRKISKEHKKFIKTEFKKMMSS